MPFVRRDRIARMVTSTRWWPQIVVLAVLLSAGAVLLTWINFLSEPDAPAGEAVAVVTAQTPAIKAELVRRMTTLLEQLPPEQHEGHGGVSEQPATSVCGARVYGYEPSTAQTADQVTTVYGFHMCGLAQPGLPWDRAMKMVAPLVIRFDRQPPRVQMAESGAGVSYQDRVRQLFPAQYQRPAFEEALGSAGMADLQRRYAVVSRT
jgi:hypothetical protein